MSNGIITRGDDQTVSIPVSNFFPTTIGYTASLFVVPLTSTPPDVYDDPSAIIASEVGPFVSDVTSFDFELTSAAGDASSLVPLGEYDWYVRVKDGTNKLTSIKLSPETVEVIPPKGEGC